MQQNEFDRYQQEWYKRKERRGAEEEQQAIQVFCKLRLEGNGIPLFAALNFITKNQDMDQLSLARVIELRYNFTLEDSKKLIDHVRDDEARYYQRKKAKLQQTEAIIHGLLTESRKGGVTPITMPVVVTGLRLIAEAPGMDQLSLAQGLIRLGCNFTLEDLEKQFSLEGSLFDGMKKGKIECGAYVIVNTRDKYSGRAFAKDRLLRLDDDMSIYHFIRLATGDPNYTKATIDKI